MFTNPSQLPPVGRALVIGALAALSMGCSGSRDHQAVFVHSPGYGRPATCPDAPVDPEVGLGPSATSTRCSYDDAAGGGLVQLRGAVLLEADGDQQVPKGVEQAKVNVIGPDGKAVGRATSDVQGAFSVSLNLRPGQYELQAIDPETGAVLVRRTVVVPEGRTGAIEGLDLVLPLDDRLRDDRPQ